MRMTILAIATALILVGCGKEPVGEPEGTSQTAAEVAIPETEQDKTCGAGKGFDALPMDACVPSVYRFRNAREYVDGQGRDRRRLTFDFSDSDALAVAEQVSAEFAKRGYNVRPTKETADGSLQVPITRKDIGTIYLSVLAQPGADNPGRKGSFFVDFLQNPL